jgi:glucosamine-6-phosphate deaminase
MKVIVCKDAEEASLLATQEVLTALDRKPDLVLGLATGSTPVGIYNRLIQAHRDDGVDFSRVRTFNLDEYVGLDPEHPQSYRSFMRRHLFDRVNVRAENIHFPPTEGPGLSEKFRQHEELIRGLGGIDIQILGIGSNGHIGFNEPTSSLASRTRLKTLTEKTLRDNSRFYDRPQEQPQLAATLGIGTILDARRILLQAFGAKKTEAVKACVEGPVSSFWPGSALQLHSDVTFYLDPDSASGLTMREYYERTRRNERALEDEGLL